MLEGVLAHRYAFPPHGYTFGCCGRVLMLPFRSEGRPCQEISIYTRSTVQGPPASTAEAGTHLVHPSIRKQ